MRINYIGMGSRHQFPGKPFQWKPLWFILMLLALGTVQRGRADTTLWQIGVNDFSSTEFGDYTKGKSLSVEASSAKLQSADWHAFPKGLRADTNPILNLHFLLGKVPSNGSEFSFRLLQAPASGAQMAVFVNGMMCGMIQVWGTAGTESPYRWQKTYRLYIPKELLQKGANSLRLEAVRPLWSDASADSRVWWEWDYLKMAALDHPAVEPIHGTLAFLGTTLKHGEFFVNDNTLKFAQTALPWLGIAYSGNTIRCDFWYDVASQQPRRLEYLNLLRDYNMTVCVDNVSASHFHNDADGRLPAKIQTDLSAFFQMYGGLFQYYEVGNEPCMFGGGMAETLELAHFLNRIKPAHVKITASGWAYGGGKGTPVNWDADPANRRQVELLSQATNGHSYGYSYADNKGGSFLENLRTFEGVKDGWPREYVNTETGTNDYHSEENGPHLASTQPHAQAFDRIMRAHLAVVDRTMQHAAIFDDFGLFAMPRSFNDMNALSVLPGFKGGEDSRVQTFRRLALAYATHGAPLPYVYLNRSAMEGKHVYFRAVDTAGLAPLPGSHGVSDKVLLNFVNFENTPQEMRVRVTLPVKGSYTSERFGPGATYAESHSSETLTAAPTLDLTVLLPARESVQYIMTPPHSASHSEEAKPSVVAAPQGVDARSGNNHMTIQWKIVPGIRYEILRATGFYGSWLTVKRDATGGRWEDTQVTNGTPYLYALIATQGGAKSPPSVIGGVPQPPVGAPARLTARAADSVVILQWEAAHGALNYRIKRAEGPTGAYTILASGIGGTTFSDSTAQNGISYRYVVVGSNADIIGSDSDAVAVTASGVELSVPWGQADIGAVGKSGSARYTPSGKLYTVRGSGTDIWGAADSFHFVYRTLTGDGSITAHLAASDATDPWCKIGIVLRSSLEPGATMAYAAITAERGSGCTFRAIEGGMCEWSGGDRRTWVRLVRKGQTVSAFVSADGQNWEPRGSAVIALPNKALIGLGVCSHNNAVLNTSLFDNIKIE